MAQKARLQFIQPTAFSFEPRDWPQWKKRWDHYHLLSKMKDEDEEFQVHALIYSMGERADEVLASFKLSEADRKVYKTVMDALNNHFVGTRNVVYERAMFGSRNQEEGESIEQFVTTLHTMSEYCEYADLRETLVRDRVVLGVRDKKLSEKLMLMTKLTLKKAVETAKQWETVKQQQQDLNAGAEEVKMDRVAGQSKYQRGTNAPKNRKTDSTSSCNKCGSSRRHDGDCPAKASKCHNCQKIGHWAKVCRSQAVHEVQEEQKTGSSFLGTLEDKSNRQQRWTATVGIEKVPIEFKLDPGADVTAIPFWIFRKKWKESKLEKADRKLFGANGGELRTVGMFHADMTHKDKKIWEMVYVIRGLHRSLLGLRACEDLGLVQRLDRVKASSSEILSRPAHQLEVRTGSGHSKVTPKREFPKLFTGLCRIDIPYKIKLKEDSKPYATSAPRRIPLPLMDRVKTQLEEMVQEGVIAKVDEPTDWCAPMVIAPKPNGGIRLCVDLTKLNKCVERELHPMPVVEHTLGQLGGAKMFSKLDANSGFYQITLAEESMQLTTFITPFGRFMFRRLPMGITSAPEHFQKRITQILEGIPGVTVHIDDILVYGSTAAEHDKRLREVLRRLEVAGVTLCPKKCQFGLTQVKFLGHIVDENGVRPDPTKVEAIMTMPAPASVPDVRRILGMINYVGRFVPQLSDVVQPLNELLRDDVDFRWDNQHAAAFEKIKKILSSEPVLALYDVRKDTKISADASSYGLGAVLLQKDKEGQFRPVAYASRSLSSSEKRYAQIEKEALASLWACDRFQDFVTGRHFVIETDHKPLLQILATKELDDLSPRLQRFRMKLMRYSYDVQYIPGKQLITADALSRAPLDEVGDSEESADVAAQVSYVLANISASDERLGEIWRHQQEDGVIQQLAAYSVTGWPDKKKIDPVCQKYWSVRDELTVQDGMLMRGSRLVIPAKMREEILGRIHSGHMGIVKCRARAREAVWWPGISEQIAEMIRRCPVCVQERNDKHEPLLPSEFPERPWQKVGLDLFKLEGKWYLVVMDFYSRYPEVTELSKLTAAAVINRCQSFFARHGVPEEVRSDCGSQFKELETSEFRQFAKEYGFIHRTSSPRYPQSNGFAESAVKTVKTLIKKNGDPYKALLEYRATPLENGYSPAELLMGRRLRTTLPMNPKKLVPELVDQTYLKEREEGRRKKQKASYDKHHGVKAKEDLSPGDVVWVKDLRTWGTIVRQHGSPRSYIVDTPRGQFRRNTFHLIRGHRREDPSTDIEVDFNEVEEPQAVQQHQEDHRGAERQQPYRTRYGRIVRPVEQFSYK